MDIKLYVLEHGTFFIKVEVYVVTRGNDKKIIATNGKETVEFDVDDLDKMLSGKKFFISMNRKEVVNMVKAIKSKMLFDTLKVLKIIGVE